MGRHTLCYITMADHITVRTRRFITNPLLQRRQFCVDVIHPGKPVPSKKDLGAKLAGMYKVADSNCIQLFGFKTAFGGGRSTGFGLIYDNIKACQKFEPKYRLVRAKLATARSGAGRRGRKELKNRVKKVRSGDKAKMLKAKAK
eukprot:GDKH01009256.1.p1 GENE.GDKH01009256.1~~GDKH01009256.1.p1  ORF type:complete len:144 (-),score=45.41 GDKH01009256.1:84-515(-)